MPEPIAAKEADSTTSQKEEKALQKPAPKDSETEETKIQKENAEAKSGGSDESAEFYESDEVDERYVGSDRANRYYSYKGDVSEKVIECYECFKTHSIIKEASSSLCPNCGTYISLKDYDIDTFWTSTIRTRGDVKIGKKGNIRNVTVFCHDLIVEGTLNATADCSGIMTVKKSGRVTGKINCAKLIVNSGVNAVFEKDVRAVEAEIHGSVIANFKSCQKITLHKKARIEGDLGTKNLEMHKGAIHTGQVNIG